jgi:hypothetical protein
VEEALFNTIKKDLRWVKWIGDTLRNKKNMNLSRMTHKDPSSSSATDFLHALHCWAPLKRDLPQEEQ